MWGYRHLTLTLAALAAQVIFKNSDDFIATGPPEFQVHAGPVHARLLEPTVEKRTPGTPPQRPHTASALSTPCAFPSVHC